VIAVVLVVTAVIVVRWKPSAGSRSLRDISALEHPDHAALARIVARAGDSGLRPATPPHGSFLPVRPVARGATHASPFQSTGRASSSEP